MTLVELTEIEIIGLNRKAIEDARRKDATCQQQHALVRRSDLLSCLAGVYYQDSKQGYLHLPIEKMAGLILYRVAEGQFFMDGNKRTGVLACYFFLFNNGLDLKIDNNRINELIWGFGKDPHTGKAKYREADSMQYIVDNVFPRVT